MFKGPKGTGVTVDDDGVTPPSAAEGQLTAWVGEQLSAIRAELDAKVSEERADFECLKVHVKLSDLEDQLRAIRTQLAELADRVQM